MSIQSSIGEAAYGFRMQEVLDLQRREVVTSATLLQQPEPALQQLQRQIRDQRLQTGGGLACPYCKTPVVLRMGERVKPHFAHLQKAPGVVCHLCEEDRLNEGQVRLQLYNQRKERKQHTRLKSELGKALRRHPQVKGLHISKVDDRLSTPADWLDADLSFEFNGLPLALELNPGGLAVADIHKRQAQLRAGGIVPLLVQTGTGTAVTTERESFLIDAGVQQEMKSRNDFCLRAWYRIPRYDVRTGQVAEEWRTRLVGLQDLIVRADDLRAFVCDYEEEHYRALRFPARLPAGLSFLSGRMELSYTFDSRFEDELLLREPGSAHPMRVRLQDGRPVGIAELSPQQHVDLLFGPSYASRNRANLLRQLQDLRGIGFAYPSDFLDQMVEQGWIRPMPGRLSQVHYERLDQGR